MQVSLRLSSPAAIVPTVYSSYPGRSAGSCLYLPSRKTLRGQVPVSAHHLYAVEEDSPVTVLGLLVVLYITHKVKRQFTLQLLTHLCAGAG